MRFLRLALRGWLVGGLESEVGGRKSCCCGVEVERCGSRGRRAVGERSPLRGLASGRRCPGSNAVSICGSDHCMLKLTNDRLYESKDSREMKNGSFSLSKLLCPLLVVVVLRDEFVWPQKLLRSSVGDGGKQTPESLISARISLKMSLSMRAHEPTAQFVLGRLLLLGQIQRPARAKLVAIAGGDCSRGPDVLVLLAEWVADDWHLVLCKRCDVQNAMPEQCGM